MRADRAARRSDSCLSLAAGLVVLFIAVANNIQWPRLQAVCLAPMHQRIFLPVRHPHFGGACSRNGRSEAVPVRVARNYKRTRDPSLARTRAKAHPTGGEGRNRVRKAPRPQVTEGAGRADDDMPGELGLVGVARQLDLTEIDPATLIVAGGRFNRAMDENRFVVTGRSKHRHNTLRLAERVRCHQMRALGEKSDRLQEFGDLARRIMVAKYRQTEGRLGDEDIAFERFERRTGRIGDVLVIAGSDDTQPITFHPDLRRAEYMTGRMKADPRPIQLESLAIADRLRAAGEIVAVADAHDVESFLRGQHRAMTGARVVGVAMRDQGLFDRARRIDMEAAGPAADARWRRNQDIFRTHRA